MSVLANLLSGPLAHAIGWALVHLLWRGVLVPSDVVFHPERLGAQEILRQPNARACRPIVPGFLKMRQSSQRQCEQGCRRIHRLKHPGAYLRTILIRTVIRSRLRSRELIFRKARRLCSPLARRRLCEAITI